MPGWDSSEMTCQETLSGRVAQGNRRRPQPAGPASSHPREVWSQFFRCCRAEPREGLEIEEAERGVSRKGWD